MFKKVTSSIEYIRKIPSAFLVAIVTVLGTILFLPEKYAAILAVDDFRNAFRVFLGPALLLTFSFSVARIFIYIRNRHRIHKLSRVKYEHLHNLTPEEKGYLCVYIKQGMNTVHVGAEDGIMAGLLAKGITYRASDTYIIIQGIAFNLYPWARKYLNENPELLVGAIGKPMTTQEKIFSLFKLQR